MKPFIHKYLPKKISEIEGQNTAIEAIISFIKNYKSGKAALVYGPTGSGKTCSVHTIANELGFEILEINASDFRNKAQIESIIGEAVKQKSLFFKGKLILIDEVDGLSGTKDRGGIPTLTKIISGSSFPIICTAKDPYIDKLKSLRKTCELIEFNELNATSIGNVLKRICKKEGIKYDEDAILSLSRRTSGDLRAAINDLQVLTKDNKFTKEVLDSLGERERQETITNALIKVFKTTDPKIAIDAYNYIPEDLNKVALWLDANLPKEYDKPEDLARAYEFLSKADIMNRRIMRRQHWRFLVYINAYLSAGIAVSKDEKYKKVVNYKPTMRLLKLWQAKMKYMKRKAIAEKIAEKTHTSPRRALQDTLPYIQPIFKENKELASQLAEEFELDKEEVAWLEK